MNIESRFISSLSPLAATALAILTGSCTRPNPLYHKDVPTDAGGGGGGSGSAYTGPPVFCGGSRDECSAESAVDVCSHFETTPINAFTCPATTPASPMAACQDAFCTGHGHCNITSAAFQTINGPDGTAAPICGTTGPTPSFSLTCGLLLRQCNTPPSPGGPCPNIAQTNEPPTTFCWDPTQSNAIQRCTDAFMFGTDQKVTSITVGASQTACVMPAPPNTSAYGLSGSFGNLTYTGGSAPVPLSIVRGRTLISSTPPAGVEGAVGTLVLLEARIADFTAGGNQVRGMDIALNRPVPLFNAPTEHVETAAGGPVLDIQAVVNGAPIATSVIPNSPIDIIADSTRFGVSGTVAVNLFRPAGTTITLNANGIIGAPTTLTGSCSSFPAIDKLFSFEDKTQWSAPSATVSSVTSPITNGCAALGVNGKGFFTITGAPFNTTPIANPPSRLWVDLFIPNSQPNPFWTGALQVYATCPSRNLFNAFIGQNELTNLKQQAYSSLPFVLPTSVRNALTSSAPDCQFIFALNVNQTNATWMFDNLRLVP